MTKMQPALAEFLNKIHTYKAIGDVESAKEFFGRYSKVDSEMLRLAEIVKLHNPTNTIE